MKIENRCIVPGCSNHVDRRYSAMQPKTYYCEEHGREASLYAYRRQTSKLDQTL